MKKKFLTVSITLLLLISAISIFVACSAKKFSVSFVQEGEKTIVVEVEEGGKLDPSDIPVPKAKTGYTVVWGEANLNEIKSDLTVRAVETANSYVVSYDTDGGTEVPNGRFTYDSAYELPNTSKSGFILKGWYLGGELIESGSAWKIADNVTLKAKWAEARNVSFVQEGYDTIVVKVENGGSVKPSDIPMPKAKIGYTVTWEDIDLTNITADISVGVVETANSYVVSYDTDGGTEVANDRFTYDSAYELPTPSKSGFIFKGWYVGDELIESGSAWKIAGDVTLKAKWAETCNVYFVQEGYDTVIIEVKNGGSVNPSDIPMPKIKTGYTVTWEEVDLTDITTNITVNAVETANSYAVSYDADGGTEASDDMFTYDSAYELPTTSKSGFIFKGWYSGDELIESGSAWKIADDVTLKAKWAEIYNVSFVQEGQETVVIMVEQGDSLASSDLPTPKTKTGYTVTWEAVDLTDITSNITVHAVEIAKTYTVSYDTDGGTELQNGRFTYDSAYELPTTSKSGFNFKGWYLGSDLVESGSAWKIANNVTLKAKWTLNVEYSSMTVHDVIKEYNREEAIMPGDWGLVDINLGGVPADNSAYRVRLTLNDSFGEDPALFGDSKAYIRFFGNAAAWSGENDIEQGSLGVCIDIESSKVSLINFAGSAFATVSYGKTKDFAVISANSTFVLEVGSFNKGDGQSIIYIMIDDEVVAWAEYETGTYAFGNYISFGVATPKVAFEDTADKTEPVIDETKIATVHNLIREYNGNAPVKPGDWGLGNVDLGEAPEGGFAYQVRVTLSDTFGADPALYGASTAYIRFFGNEAAWSGENDIEKGSLGICFNFAPYKVTWVNFAGGDVNVIYKNRFGWCGWSELSAGSSFVLEVGGYDIGAGISCLYVKIGGKVMLYAEYETGTYAFGRFVSFGVATPKVTFENAAEKVPEPVIDYTKITTVYDVIADKNGGATISTGSWTLADVNLGETPTNNFAYRMQINYGENFGGDPNWHGTSKTYIRFFGNAAAWSGENDIEKGSLGICFNLAPSVVAMVNYAGGEVNEIYT